MSATSDLVLEVADDGPIFRLALAAGTVAALRAAGAEGLGLPDQGVRSISLEVEPGGGAVLHLATEPLDLSAAELIEHMVSVSLHAGLYESAHTRLWHSDGERLFTGS